VFTDSESVSSTIRQLHSCSVRRAIIETSGQFQTLINSASRKQVRIPIAWGTKTRSRCSDDERIKKNIKGI
jgi:hypothetical protein